jgi:potassium/hydrogen antiporter
MVGLRGAVPIFLAIIPVLAELADAATFFGVAFITVLTSLIVQGWTVATAARMLDLDVPPAQEASRLDIDLPGRLGDENTVVGYRVEARCPAASKAVEALPLPPTASVLVVIRDGIARTAASAPPLAPGDYVLALARPQDLVLLDRLFGPRPERSSGEADLPPEIYAYRAGRNAQQAAVEVEELLFRGLPEIVDADLADYFGSIPPTS